MSGAFSIEGSIEGDGRASTRAAAVTADDALLLRARGGDRDAFAVLVERHAQTVTRVLHQRAGARAPVEDLVQEAFARALANLGGFRGRASFLTWTTSIALNLATDWRRREVRRARLAPRAAVEHDDVPSPVVCAATAFEAREDAQRARAALDELPLNVRLAVTLRVVEELPYETVAARLGVGVPRARTWVSRGLARLRRRMEACDGRA